MGFGPSGTHCPMTMMAAARTAPQAASRCLFEQRHFHSKSVSAKSKIVSPNLLFVMLQPLFAPQESRFSQLFNLTAQPLLIHSVLDKIALHPGWNVIVDDDASCLRKLRTLWRLGVVSLASVAWMSGNASVAPMYRSDLCRLAQLYLHGGLYLDNDVELLVPLGLQLGPGVTCNVDWAIHDANNAIFAAPPRHALVFDCLQFFDAVANGTREHIVKRDGFYGPSLLGEAIRRRFGSYYACDNRRELRRAGLELLVERPTLPGTHPLLQATPHLRNRKGPCAFHIVNESSGEVIAFSRVKKYNHPLEPCSGSQFWQVPEHHPGRLKDCVLP